MRVQTVGTVSNPLTGLSFDFSLFPEVLGRELKVVFRSISVHARNFSTMYVAYATVNGTSMQLNYGASTTNFSGETGQTVTEFTVAPWASGVDLASPVNTVVFLAPLGGANGNSLLFAIEDHGVDFSFDMEVFYFDGTDWVPAPFAGVPVQGWEFYYNSAHLSSDAVADGYVTLSAIGPSGPESIVFAQIAGGETSTPLPEAKGAGALRLRGFGFESFALGAIGYGALALTAQHEGNAPNLPVWGMGYGELAVLGGYAYGPSVEDTATAAGVLRLRGHGYESPNFGGGVLPLIGFGLSLADDDVSVPPEQGDTLVSVEDTLRVGVSSWQRHIALLRARFAVDGDPRVQWEGVSTLRAGLTFEDGLGLVFRELLVASAVLSDGASLSHLAVEQMVDALVLGGVVGGQLEALQLIADALAFGASLDAVAMLTLSDALSLSDLVEQAYTAAGRMLDALLVGDRAAPGVTLMALVHDVVRIGDGSAGTLDARTLFRDELAFGLRLSIDNAEYVAWALNTESKGLSRYTHYPFNSFMRVGGRYYGATDTGVYRLEGDDDAGEPIAARIRLGLSSMGARALKRVPAMYAGYTATGDLLLKVVLANAEDGEREAHAYRLKAVAAQSMREGRVPIGRGLKSVYFDFELENIDGADFELDMIEFLPLLTERRVRGNSGGKR